MCDKYNSYSLIRSRWQQAKESVDLFTLFEINVK